MSEISHRLAGEDYLASLQRDGERLASAAERNMSARVAGCPGWEVADLVWHMGEVHHLWASIVERRIQDRSEIEPPKRPGPDELMAWYRSNLEATVESLRAADPEATVWSWTPEKTVAWVRRRMAQETAVHRWDAESATGSPRPIDTALAVDGIDEFLEFFVTKSAGAPDLSVHLHATDAEGEWLAVVREGRLLVEHRHSKADVAVRGKASDLLLLLWSRIPEADVRVNGDRVALFKFLELSDLD